jgi:hypothetical protein
MLASELFSSPVTNRPERVTTFSASVSRPGGAPQWDDESTTSAVIRHLQLVNDSLHARDIEVQNLLAERQAQAERLLLLQRTQADLARSTENLARTASGAAGAHPDQQAATALLETIFQSVEDEQKRIADAQQKLAEAAAQAGAPKTPSPDGILRLRQRLLDLSHPSNVGAPEKEQSPVTDTETPTPPRDRQTSDKSSRVLADDYAHMGTLSLTDLMSTVGSGSSHPKNAESPDSDLDTNALRSALRPA